MLKYALIVAGGIGKRMGTNSPKQFLEVAGKPILMHTFSRFTEAFTDINFILVLPENQFTTWKELCAKHQFDIPHQLVAGGETRFESVKNGLKNVENNGVVGIHDGVRPLVSATTLRTAYETAISKTNAVPVIDMVESIRKVKEGQNEAVDRSVYKIVQTPQCFNASIVKKAYEQNYQASFTDDATVVESAGHKINLVQGNRENIKVTTMDDLDSLKSMLGKHI